MTHLNHASPTSRPYKVKRVNGTPPVVSESRLQADCFQWFHNNFPYQRQMLFHVQNKARNAIEGNKFKAMGVVKGVSDLILILPGRVIFIELKTETGKQLPEQEMFQFKVQERCHQYIVIRNLESFKEFIMGIRQFFPGCPYTIPWSAPPCQY